jgi:hypothetical protein
MLCRVRSVAAGCKVSLVTVTRFLKTDVSKLVPMMEHMVSDRDIDQERENDADPDWDVVGVNAHERPLGVNPALQLRGCQQWFTTYCRVLTTASPKTGPLGSPRMLMRTIAEIRGPPKHIKQYTQRCLRNEDGFALKKKTR